MCNRVEDWLQEHCDGYRCMHVPRPQTWDSLQEQIDLIAEAGAFGREGSLQVVARVAQMGGSEQLLLEELHATARKLIGKAQAAGLPSDIGPQIEFDVAKVGSVVAKLLPSVEEVVVKLELMGESVCTRWHQDNYTSRAIITYNGPGTVYVDHDSVNFWELNNCGNNDHILRDKSRVRSASASDILFIKGKLFPGSMNGLVHKSPEKRYRANGAVLNRLCLKVDVK